MVLTWLISATANCMQRWRYCFTAWCLTIDAMVFGRAG
ncbi:hypothetical protein DAI22_07g128900 [Oryza sativa Japonica Group]|nr:hypothetical protein DAI22_07g128900 [Oryza sativa Japonica Group]